MQSNFI